jgi:hypothetical protein
MPRETVSDKKVKFEEKVNRNPLKDVKLHMTAIVLIDKNAVIPGVSAKYLSQSATGKAFKTKIFLPKFHGINYVGLIIGPKGIYQKKLEEKTGCKILIRGKGSHKDGHPMSANDNEEQHVLLIGDSEDGLIEARKVIQHVLTADEDTRN